MIVYWIIAISIAIFTLISGSNKKRLVLYYFSSFVLCFIGTFRSNTVGTDTHYVYFFNFQHTTFDLSTWNLYTEFEPGFNFLIAIMKYINDNYHFFYGFIFFATFSLFVYFIKNVSYNPLLSLSFFIWLGYYTTEFNIMRQYWGLSIICLLICIFLEKRKFILYTIICFCVSILFHRSLIIFCFAPFFYLSCIKNLLSKKLLIILLCFSIICFFILRSFVGGALDVIAPLLGAERYQGYILNSIDQDYEISPIMIMLQTLFCIYVILVLKHRDIFFYLYWMGIFLRNCLLPVIPITFRLVDTLILFSFIVFSNLYVETRGRNAIIYKSIVITYSFIYFYLAMDRNYNEVIPYSNWLFNN